MMTINKRLEQVSVDPPKTIRALLNVPVLMLDTRLTAANGPDYQNMLTCYVQNIGGANIYYSFDYDTPTPGTVDNTYHGYIAPGQQLIVDIRCQVWGVSSSALVAVPTYVRKLENRSNF